MLMAPGLLVVENGPPIITGGSIGETKTRTGSSNKRCIVEFTENSVVVRYDKITEGGG